MTTETKTQLKERVQSDITGYAHNWFVATLESEDPELMTDAYQAELCKQMKRLQRAFGFTSFNGLDS